MNAAIIVAAGSSRRMGEACTDKLLLSIRGMEVLARTMLQYERAASIHQIFVVTSEERVNIVSSLAQKYKITKFKGTALGGDTRQQSVQNGLALCPEADIAVIADGARPFTKPEHIVQVCAVAEEKGAAVLCVPVKDTIKVLAEDGTISHTPPRHTLLAAQTPQALKMDLFTKRMQQAAQEGKSVTDDVSVFEIYGHQVYPVIGDYDNIKITTPEDISLATAIAEKEDQSL